MIGERHKKLKMLLKPVFEANMLQIGKAFKIVSRDLIKNRYIYLMLVPVLLYFVIFRYVPMYGVQIAFKDYSFSKGFWGSSWIGLKNFEDFFSSIYAWRVIRNTLLININLLIFSFPAPIILALLINEIKNKYFKRVTQTITYMPYFISLVVVVGIMYDFFSRDGLVENILGFFGQKEAMMFFINPKWFRMLYVGSSVWQEAGWGSIIYLAALSSINPELYEASRIDGAGRWKQAWHITIPGIMSVIVMLLILRIGTMMDVGYEKIILMYNPLIRDTADVISTYVYRRGIQDMSYSFSAAVGFLNSVINLTLLVTANMISRKVSENKLW